MAHRLGPAGQDQIGNMWLLDAGAKTDIQNNEGWTALSHAAWQGHADAVRLLLLRGADPRLPNNDGQTPRILAMSRGYTDIMQILQ